MTHVFGFLKNQPFVLVFLVVGAGFLLARVKIFAISLGVGMWMAALNVKYRDIRYALPFMVSIWMYATPVIYPVSFIPGRWRWILMLNPLSGIVEAFRAAIFDTPFHWGALGIAALITIVVLVWAAYSFRQMEREFADVI